MGSENDNRVYQFMITIKGISPPIWRRIQVPEDCSFFDLHVAIQNAFIWFDSHLHEFRVQDINTCQIKDIGIPSRELDTPEGLLAGWETPLASFFNAEGMKCNYTYDFGDNWEHKVVLEKILPKINDTKYPVCIGGRRFCPPEDCGGVGGYYDLIEAITDPNHERHEELLEWVGPNFDPEYFDISEISFLDPIKRLQEYKKGFKI